MHTISAGVNVSYPSEGAFHLCQGDHLSYQPHCRSTPKYNQNHLPAAAPVVEMELALVAVMMSNPLGHQFVTHTASCADPVSLSRAGSRPEFRRGCQILCAAQVVGRPQQRSCDSLSLEEEMEVSWLEMTRAGVVGACDEKGWGWGSQAARVACETVRCCY
jgi:hypothetical protein